MSKTPVLRAAALADHVRAQAASGADLLLVEGAGGWLVPLNETETMADLAVALGYPVILVVGMRLGCINHALLTAAAIKAAGLELAGWVANGMTPEMDALAENSMTIRKIARPGANRPPSVAWMKSFGVVFVISR